MKRTDKAAAAAECPPRGCAGGRPPPGAGPTGGRALGAPAARRQAGLEQIVRRRVRHRGEAGRRKNVGRVQECAAQAVHYQVLRVERVQVGR